MRFFLPSRSNASSNTELNKLIFSTDITNKIVKVLFQKALEKGYCGLLNRMRSTSDIQFFVCRSRIIPEPPFPSQGIAGSGNEIVASAGHMTPRICGCKNMLISVVSVSVCINNKSEK